jgi:hypothetical protein
MPHEPRPFKIPDNLPPDLADPPDWALRYAAESLSRGVKVPEVERTLIARGLHRRVAAKAVERWFDRRFDYQNCQLEEKARSLRRRGWLGACFGAASAVLVAFLIGINEEFDLARFLAVTATGAVVYGVYFWITATHWRPRWRDDDYWLR